MGGRLSTPLSQKLLATAPAAPPSGSVLLYFKSDGKLYKKDAAGIETEVGAAGGSLPANVVLTDTVQTITGTKTFTGPVRGSDFELTNVNGAYAINANYNGSAWVYIATGRAFLMQHNNTTGNIEYKTAISGTAGDIIAWLDRATIGETGVTSGGNVIGSPLTTAVTNASFSNAYPDNTSYFRYVITTDGFPVNGILTGARIAPNHTQRIQSISTGQTYSRYWNIPGSAWSAWVLYLDVQDFDAKGDLLVGTGADTYALQTIGANGTVLTADSTLATGVKWATPSGGGANTLTTDTAQTLTTAGVKQFPPNTLLMRSADGLQTAEPYSDVNAPQTLERTITTEPASPIAGKSIEWTTDGKSLSMKAADGVVTRIGPGAPLATAITNTSANSVYPDNSSYFRYSTTVEGFVVNGILTGARIGTIHTQRIQDIATAQTYARTWNNAGSAWSAWVLYLDVQDFDAKGDLLVGTGADTYALQTIGANGTVLTADSTLATGVKWATPSGGGAGGSGTELAATTDFITAGPTSPTTGIKLFSRFGSRRHLSVVGPSGQDSRVANHPGTNRIVEAWCQFNIAGISVVGSQIAVVGSALVAAPTFTGKLLLTMARVKFASAATAGSAVGFRIVPAQNHFSTAANTGGFHSIMKFGIDVTAAGARMFHGFYGTNAAIAGTAEPSSLLNTVGFACDAADTAIQFIRNDATGVATKVSTSFLKNDVTAVYEVEIFSASGSGQKINASIKRLNDGTIWQSGDITTDLPALNLGLLYHYHWTNGTTAAVSSSDFCHLHLETDN